MSHVVYLMCFCSLKTPMQISQNEETFTVYKVVKITDKNM